MLEFFQESIAPVYQRGVPGLHWYFWSKAVLALERRELLPAQHGDF
jgi:hypothetical protein